MLTFDEPTHTYRFDGRVVPSVTQCLQHLHSFAMVDEQVLAIAQDRGVFVHDMCHAHDVGDLDESRVPEEYLGYLAGWKKFNATYEPNWAGIEVRGYSQIYGFAGTEDRHGRLGRIYPGARFGLDIKTSVQSHPAWGLQLAAYRQLRVEREGFAASLDRRATVQLSKDGGFTFTEWNDPADWPTFCALLNLISWSKKCPN